MGCHFFLQGNLPNPGIEPVSLVSPALAGGLFTTMPPWEAMSWEVIAVFAILQVRESKGLDSGSDHDNVE